MGFPLAPGDGDKYTNALGTMFKYVAADDKWIVIGRMHDYSTIQTDISIRGLVMSIDNPGGDANDMNVTAGACVDSAQSIVMVLTNEITKQCDAAWAVGDDAGGDDGTLATDSWNYVWLIYRSDTEVVDVLLSASATAPTMPANYDYKRRIGAFYYVNAGTDYIKPFYQQRDHFYFIDYQPDKTWAVIGDANRHLLTVTVPPNMIGIIDIQALLGTNSNYIYVKNVDETDTIAVNYVWYIYNGVIIIPKEILVDGSSQIAYRSSLTTAYLAIHTRGWIDLREP